MLLGLELRGKLMLEGGDRVGFGLGGGVGVYYVSCHNITLAPIDQLYNTLMTIPYPIIDSKLLPGHYKLLFR